MQNKHYLTIVLFLLVAGTFLSPIAAQAGGEEEIVVIANENVTVSEISLQDLRDFYQRDRMLWPDDKNVVLFDLKPRSQTKESFYDYLGKSSSRMKSIWLKKMLSGEGDPPEAVESESLMVQRVSETPGAIGFVSRKNADEAVKIVMVIPTSSKK